MSIDRILKSKFVHIIAPASGFDVDVFNLGVEKIQQWGFDVQIPKALKGKHPYLAQTDEIRFQQLKTALNHPDPCIIWAARGGYGCGRLIQRLSKLKKPKVQKLLVGYSDISWLHHFVSTAWGWKSLHAPLVTELAVNKLQKTSITQLKKLILSQETQIQLGALKPMNHLAKKSKTISGNIAGGSLKVLETTLGTPCRFSAQSKIAFFEDTGERGYALDRSLVHFMQADVFNGCRAIVLGEFLSGQERSGKSYVSRALKEFADSVNVPVFKGLKVGHGKNNLPIMIGSKACIKMTSGPRIEYKV